MFCKICVLKKFYDISRKAAFETTKAFFKVDEFIKELLEMFENWILVILMLYELNKGKVISNYTGFVMCENVLPISYLIFFVD